MRWCVIMYTGFYHYALMKNRCERCLGSEEYIRYHDEEWWVPVFDDTILFEFLILEWAKAWLSRQTILKKRYWYRRACKYFDPSLCARFSDDYLASLKSDEGIVRNKLKIASIRKNAIVFLRIQEEFGSFSEYLWWWVEGKQIQNNRASLPEVPATSDLSDLLSKDLKSRWMSFVGSTIMYAYLQAVWVIDDHVATCRKRM